MHPRLTLHSKLACLSSLRDRITGVQRYTQIGFLLEVVFVLMCSPITTIPYTECLINTTI